MIVDIAIAGGRVFSARGGRDLNVLINGEKIVALVQPGTEGIEAAETIDATGLWVLPGMIERRSGNIIHLTGKGATDATLVKPGTGATKAALEQFVRGTALEVAGYNVAVNCLDPGGIRTERGMARTPDRDWTGVAVPADVGPSAVHLACQDASSMTGQVFRRVEFDG